MKFSKMIKIGLGLSALLFVSQVQAIPLTSYSLTTNANPDADASWFDVSMSLTGSQVTFTIANLAASGNNTKISDIYFGADCGVTGNDGFCSFFQTGISSLTYGGAMDYQVDFGPTGGSQILNNAGWGVAVLGDAQGGSAADTINAGESLGVTFDLLAGLMITEADLIDAFLPVGAGQDLGIAFHVQSIGAYSEWYSATPPETVPEPGMVALLSVGLLGMVAIRRKKTV